MLLRDGRRQLHDLGPTPAHSSQIVKPWLMEPIGYTGKSGTGGWSRALVCKRPDRVGSTLTEPKPRMTPVSTPKAIVAARPRARRPVEEKRAYDRAYSRANREHRRLQLRAWRERQRAVA